MKVDLGNHAKKWYKLGYKHGQQSMLKKCCKHKWQIEKLLPHGSYSAGSAPEFVAICTRCLGKEYL